MYLGALVSTSQPTCGHRYRRRRLRRVDRARAATARRSCDAHRRVGTRARARQFRRRDAHHPLDLRDARRLHEDGPSSPGALASPRPRAPAVARDRGPVDVRRRRQLRSRVGASAARTRSQPRISWRCRTRRNDTPRSISTASARCSSSRRPDICSRARRAKTSSHT